jgi:predicted aconitase with swiveling domain
MDPLTTTAAVLIDGTAEGEILRLEAAISFWGGVDARSGVIVQGGHPDYGRSIADTILALPALIGSSSSSGVLLELLYIGKAPRALLLQQSDAILTLGVVVAREMGYGSIPVLLCDLARFSSGQQVRIEPQGRILVRQRHD